MRLFQIFSLGLLISASGTTRLLAQITPDSTLPRPSNVIQNGDQFEITGGTSAGSNLFHSFDRFSVPTGGSASFRDVNTNIENIFSRITGSNISRIDGLIEVLDANGIVSSANFFLLNPNGILFGENAALNIGGSFLATTADRIDFADRASFSATNSQSTLLTVSAPIGLQFGSTPGRIVNRSIAPLLDAVGNPLLDDVNNEIYGLRVPNGETLALIGGDVDLIGGWLNAAGGRIELGSVAGRDRVDLSVNASGIQLDYNGVQNGDIRLFSDPVVNVSGLGGGSIQIQGDRVTLQNGAFVLADTYGSRNGAGIVIRASQLTLNGFSLIQANTYGSGRGGNISVQSNQLVINNNSLITTNTGALERGSNISVGSGRGGNISVQSNQLVINNNSLSATNTGASGRGGNISVTATDFIELTGAIETEEGIFSSGLFALVNPTATATSQGGNLSVNTNRLSIRDGATISIDTYSAGDAGAMTIRASEIEIRGIGRSETGEPFLFERVPAAPSSLSAFTSAGGRGGNIDVQTQRLTLEGGATIQASTQSSSDAGGLQIRAIDRVEVIGTAADLDVPTGLLTFSGGIPGTEFGFGDRVTGDGANLIIETGSLIIRDGAVVAVGSLNPDPDAGRSGNLRVSADLISLENQASLLANTNSGNGGNLNLRVQDAIVLRNNSSISTTAGVAGRGGNGGDIRINTDFILSTLPENNDITANAFTGNGGNVTIAAEGILGIAPQDRLTQASDITASSEFGNSGAIVITNPTDDPSQGLVELPANLIDASRQIAQSCGSGATARQSSEFVVTGRGGLPPSPIDSRSSAAILSQWATLSETGEMAVAEAPSAPAIVEAQGWVTNADGEVMLVAAAPIAPAEMTIAQRSRNGIACR